MNNDPVVMERLLLNSLESVDEWSFDGDLNTRRSIAHD